MQAFLYWLADRGLQWSRIPVEFRGLGELTTETTGFPINPL
jgi:hypothetical protein